MELIKILSSFYFLGGVIAASLLVAFLFEDVKKVNVGFVLVALFLSWWSFGFYFWITADNYNSAGFWVGVASFGATLMPVAFYNWIVFLLEKDRKYLILFGYLISMGFALFSFTGLYYRDLSIVGGSTFWPRAGGVYIFYIIFIYLGFFVLGIYELINNLLEKKKNSFLQADKNVLLFSVLILVLGISNFPLWYGIDIPPLGGLLSIFVNLFLLFYVVLKFNLINKKSFYAQSLIGAILVINGLDILFSDDLFEIGYKSVMLIFLMLFSNLLIKSYKEDITQKEDLFRLGKKLEASNKKLKELDSAKNEFISIAAHQLRTPPTVIKGYLNLAKEDPNNKLDEETRDSLSRALASNDRLIELVDDILNISRIESGKMQYEFHANQSIGKILKELAEIFEAKAKDRGLKLKLELPKAKLPDLIMDSNKIREVISNLIDNALKYTAKGEIKIKCLLTEDRERVRIEVSDTGMGISRREIGNLFKKFSRGSNADKISASGIGLGIYVGRKIIEAHKGKIWVESPGLERGSTFIIELPIESDLE